MRKLSSIVLFLVLPVGALAQPITLPISSPNNGGGVSSAISITPLDGSGVPSDGLKLEWPAGSIGSSTAFNFQPIPAPYTLTGFQVQVGVTGDGFVMDKPMVLRYPVPALSIPTGIPVKLTVNAPSIGAGSLVVELGPDSSPPTTPTLTLTPGQTSVSASWTGAQDNVGVVGYILERTPGTVGPFTQIALTTANLFVDLGLTSATVYSYRVRASDAAGNTSSYSAVATTTTLAPPPPPPPSTPPSSFTASAPGDCTGSTVANAECKRFLASLTDSTGSVWTLVNGVPFRQAPGASVAVKTNNVYAPGIKYLFVVVNTPTTVQIRSRNNNGTYACWTGTAWGC